MAVVEQPQRTGSEAHAAHPYAEGDIGRTQLLPTHRVDLRTFADADRFIDANSVSAWSDLRWSDIGRPYRVENWSDDKREWERRAGAGSRGYFIR